MVLPKKLSDWPQYYGHTIQWEVTDGRPGGLDHGQLPHVI